ncbi:hypothetical protein [Halalkalibacter urbisdiaboli]|uniref:hypothetical protein n=1 Tax=Halalkalibacter urbisdiaboli TaxID=1960589 RepID=UPI000B453EB4|nr:hypothetical protein [Halalkalibacter urbisdiaboli]
MKTFFNFYIIPALIFLLLTTSQLREPTLQEITMAALGGISVGLFAGLVLHMAILIGKKMKK